MRASVLSWAALYANSKASRTPSACAMPAASRTLAAEAARSPWPGPTALMTRGQPKAFAVAQDSANTPRSRARSWPSAWSQPISTPTQATASPEALTQPQTSASVLPASRARTKSTRRSSTASHPARLATANASGSGVESSVHVWSASGFGTPELVQGVAERSPADARDGLGRIRGRGGAGHRLLGRLRRLGLGGGLLRHRLPGRYLLRCALDRLLLCHGAESTPCPRRRSTHLGLDEEDGVAGGF